MNNIHKWELLPEPQQGQYPIVSPDTLTAVAFIPSKHPDAIAVGKLIAAAPDMLECLMGMRGIEAWIADPTLKAMFQQTVYAVIDKATK